MDAVPSRSRGERIWHYARWLLLATAISWQILHHKQFGGLQTGFFNPDKVSQIAAAQSLLDGMGVTMPLMDWADPGTPQLETVVHWPPGYSLLFAAGLAVTPDVWSINLVLDVVASVLFFTAWFVMIERLGPRLGVAAKLLFWLYFALVWNPLMLMTSSENLAMGFYCWALAWALVAVDGRHFLLASLASGACAAAAAAMRYPCWPLIIVPPTAILVAGVVARQTRRLAPAAILSLVMAASLVAAMAGWQRWTSGHTTCLTSIPSMKTVGLYWANLLQVCPFPVSAVGFAEIWNACATKFHWYWAAVLARGCWIGSAAVLLLLTPLLYRRWAGWREWLRLPAAPRMAAFLVAGLLTAGVTVALLVYLSLRTPPDPLQRGFTYVNESRYYAVFFAFIELALACSIVRLLAGLQGRVGTVLRVALIGALVVWLSFGFGWRCQRVKHYFQDAYGIRAQRSEDRNNMHILCRAVREQVEAGRTVLFVDPAFGSGYGSHCERFDLEVARMAGACKIAPVVAARVKLTAARPTAMLVMVPHEPQNDPQGLVRALVQDSARFTRTQRLRSGWLYAAVSPSPDQAP